MPENRLNVTSVEKKVFRTTREAFMREGVDRADGKLIMNVARICARCSAEYMRHGYCPQCKYNSAQYMNGNTARASLMRINAQRDNALYYQAEAALKQRGRDADSGTVFPVVIFILFVGGLVALFRYGGPLNRKATVAPKSITTKTAPLPATPALASTDAILYKVAEALGQTHRNIKDITGDGRINCQDYSAMFLRVVSASGLEAQIIYNPNIGLTGHVFNRVRTPDGWLYVEPQRTRNWLMRQAWPEWERVRHLNQEATNTYRR